ncbi:MAG: glycine cleavage system aminomethyltransferase T/glycine [Cellvibrionaceae bacterium]|jgi:glycine cleavage system aminomethyltransferase T/glycine/D-amino acid oxidase-like deaminating enzyme
MSKNKSQKLIIVGSGMVGCAAAYHFAKEGWTNVTVIDKGELYENDGSTSHAPGGIVALAMNKFMTDCAIYSSDLYKTLEDFTPDRNTYNALGGSDIATTPERWQDMKRLAGAAKSFGVEAHLMDPQTYVDQYQPFLDPSRFLGAIYMPKGAIVAGAHVSGALARDAMRLSKGAITFIENTPMTDIEVVHGRVSAVVTANPEMPRIECDQVLLCTNIWSPAISEKLGFKLPLNAFEHQYVITEPLESLAEYDPSNKEHEILWPSFREMDSALYVRQHHNKWGVGSYWHKPHMVKGRNLGVKPGDTAMNPFTPEDLGPAWQMVQKLMPKLGLKDLDQQPLFKAFNGMFAFSVDGMPIIGESTVKGVWAATASWITHSAGVAKSAVELMTYGDTEWDIRQASINRFLPFQTTEKYTNVITIKNYREIYDIVHPRQAPSEPRNVRLTPFHERLKGQSADWTVFAGLELPNWVNENSRLLEKYEDQIPERTGWGGMYWSPIQGAEHLETRENVSQWDLTGLSIIEVAGPNSVDYVNYLCSNEMDKPVGSVIYTCWLTEKGGVKRDLAVARMEENKYWMFVGEGTRPLDLHWVKAHAPADGSVYINDVSDSFAGIGVFGPNSRHVLEKVCFEDLNNDSFPYYTGRWIEIGYHKVYAMRISYMGELGWELHVPMDAAVSVWDDIWSAGREFDMIAAGMGAMDSMRLEKGYRLWGADVYTEYSPYEAGLGWTVKLKKSADFIGKSACIALKEKGLKKKLTCLTLDNPAATLFGYEPIFNDDGIPIGYVTTSNYGYSVGKTIAYGYLPIEYTQPGTELKVEYFDKFYTATVAKEPLFDAKNSRVKA